MKIRSHRYGTVVLGLICVLAFVGGTGCGKKEEIVPPADVAAKEPNPHVILIHSCNNATTQSRGIEPLECKASSMGSDHVAWYNGTGADVTITFTAGEWPFKEAEAPITIGNLKTSAWYRVAKNLPDNSYHYATNPNHVCSQGGPTGPAIVTGE